MRGRGTYMPPAGRCPLRRPNYGESAAPVACTVGRDKGVQYPRGRKSANFGSASHERNQFQPPLLCHRAYAGTGTQNSQPSRPPVPAAAPVVVVLVVWYGARPASHSQPVDKSTLHGRAFRGVLHPLGMCFQKWWVEMRSGSIC